MSKDIKTAYLEALDKISDLESKLVEKDKAIENWQTMYEGVVRTCHNDKEEIKKLKKQNYDYADSLTKVLNENADLVFKLAEKEKEIENIKLCRCVNCTNEYEFMLEGLVEDLEKQIDKDDQDKISFCIEKLEKVKNGIESKVESIYKRLDDLNIKIVCESTSMQLDTYKEISKEIDSQIKQLKEMK